jgi:hypothetical protein
VVGLLEGLPDSPWPDAISEAVEEISAIPQR